MPVYDEGIERPCYSDDVEPIFDDADAEASNEGEQEDGPDSLSIDTTEQTRSDLEEDWLLITPSEDDKEGKTLNVLRISLDGTGRASPSRVQRAVLNSDQQDLSQSFLGRLNFFGIFSGAREGKGKGQHSSELNFLKDKVDLLQSQVTQVDELRNYVLVPSIATHQVLTFGAAMLCSRCLFGDGNVDGPGVSSARADAQCWCYHHDAPPSSFLPSTTSCIFWSSTSSTTPGAFFLCRTTYRCTSASASTLVCSASTAASRPGWSVADSWAERTREEGAHARRDREAAP